MDDVAEGVLAFIRATQHSPLPPDAPTRDVLAALRERLDADAPGWRVRALEGLHRAVEVEVCVGGRTVRGVLAQRPSAARGEAA